MTLAEAIKILKIHQKWRKGAEIDMIHPDVLTKAIEVILEHYK